MSFSVLMSVYDREKPEYLRSALESVIDQTLPPNEIVLVEDGILTEELYKVINEFANQYPVIKRCKLEQNVKLGRALAKGMELCSCELVARMDTDDIAVSDRFERQYGFLKEHPEYDIIGGLIEEFDETNPSYSRVKQMPETMSEIWQYARYRNPVNHMTVMFRKSAVMDAGNYRHFPYLEDYELWTRMLSERKEFYNLQQVLVKARTNQEQYHRRGGFAYCKQYLKLRKQQREFQLLNFKEYQIARLLTIGMTLMPNEIRRFVYQKILRK